MRMQNTTPLTSPAIEIRQSRFGMGVYATQAIFKGQPIGPLEGPLLTLAQSLQDQETDTHAIQVGAESYINILAPIRFINHSCSPNTGIINDTTLVAVRDIAPGEELYWDYSTSIDDGWSMACACGSTNCRGLISNFRMMPAHTQLSYLRQGIVMSFIAQQCAQNP